MKQSLFKQKIKQAKAIKQSKQGKTQDSFPEAIKIDLTHAKQQTLRPNEYQEKVKPFSKTNGILEDCSSLLSKQQMSKIQDQNNKLIQNMSEDQILKLRDSLLSQMPKGFIAKLLKSVDKQQLMPQNQNRQNSNLKNAQQNQKLAQQQLEEPAQAQESTKKQESQKQFMDSLFIQIQNGQILAHTEQNIFGKENETAKNEQYIVFSQLQLMIQSQNNQTQVVAAEILTKVTKNLSKYKKLIKNKGVILHKIVIINLFYQRAIRSLIFKIQISKFKSVWVELISCLCQVTKSLWKLLSQQSQEKILNTLQKSLKSKKFDEIQVIEQKITNALNFIKQVSTENLQKQFNLTEDLQNIDQIIELITLQQSQFQMGILDEKFTYLTQLARYFKTLLPEQIVEQKSIMIELTFTILWKLKVTLNTPILMRLKDNIFKFLRQFSLQLFTRQIFNTQSGKFRFQLNAINLKCVYGIKQMDPEFFDEFVKQFNQGSVFVPKQNQKQSIIALLIAFSLQKYRQQPINRVQQINNIVLLIQTLTKIFNQNYMQLPAQIFIHELLFLYQNNNSIYNQDNIKQPIDNLLAILFKKTNKNMLKLIVPIERLKMLIQKYNFSSFGSNSFTKMMFLLSTVEQQYQHLVLEQVISRYLFLFYYATDDSGVYTLQNQIQPIKLYRSSYQKQEKIQFCQMLQKDPMLNKNNIFYSYLLK